MSIDFKSINRHRGDFTRKASSAGMGVQEYARHVLANTGRYDTRTVRQASFAKAANNFEHAFGGDLYQDGGERRPGYMTPYRRVSRIAHDVAQNSAADFVARLNDADRLTIPDFEHPEGVATHKMSSGTVNAEGRRRGIVYPTVQNIDGRLVDFNDPANASYGDPFRSAVERGDYFLTPGGRSARRFAANRYKSYFPSGTGFAYGGVMNSYENYEDVPIKNFNSERAYYVRERMLKKGYNEKQIAVVINALHDETPNLEYGMGWWYRDDEGRLRKSRTKRDDWIAWDVGPFQFTDNKFGAREGTKYMDWCKKNNRDPYSLDGGLDYFLDFYLPDRLVQKPNYAKIWNDPDSDVFEMGSGFLKDILSGNNRNNAEWLKMKGELGSYIYDNRPGGNGESSPDVIRSPFTPFSSELVGVPPALRHLPSMTEDANDPYFVDGNHPPRDVKTDQSWIEPVKTAQLGEQFFAGGGELAHSHGAWWPNGLQFVNAGGTHEQNPNMGVQVGVDGEGTPNLVEEGEVIYDDYVFSNRLYPTRRELEEANLPVSYAKNTFAYIAERMGRESEERPNDAISRRGLEAMLRRLAGIQERQRRERGLVGTQKMEQGAGMPQESAGMSQGMSPEDMLAMQGGGEVPPEMLAQAAGAGVAQPEGYAPEEAGEAPEGYGGEGYLSAYGGSLQNEYGGDRNIRRFAKDLADNMPLFSDAELDDKGRRVLGDGVSQEDADLYYRKFGKKYNRLLTRAVRHAKNNPEVLYSKAMAAEQGGGAPVKPQNENMLHVANENRKLKNDARVDDVEHPILDPSEVYGGRLRYSYVLGLLDPTKGDGETKEIRGRHLIKKVAKADAVRAYEEKVREIADRNVYAEPFLGLTHAGQGHGTIRRQLKRKGYLMPYTKAYGGNIYDPTVRTASEMMNYTLPTFNGSRDLTMDLFLNSLPQRQVEFRSMLNGIMSPFYPPGATPSKIPPADKKPADPSKKYMDSNLRYASTMGPAVSALVNAFRRPDNSEAREYESIAANVPNVSVRPRMLSSYMPYNPLSRELALNPVRAQAGATRRANVGLNAGQANALNLALNYQSVPQMGKALAQTDTQNLERMKTVYDFNRQTDMTNAQNDLAAQTTNAANALQRYDLVSNLRSKAAKARSQERTDLEEARTQSLAGVFKNIGAIGKENFAYNQMLDSYGQYKSTPNGGIMLNGKEYVPVQTACGGMLTRRKRSGRV